MENYFAQLEANVLGDVGIMVTPTPRMKSGKPDPKAAAIIAEAWARFGEKENFTAQRQLTRAAWSRRQLRSTARDGDSLVEIIRGFDNRDAFAVSAWEADYLDFDDNDTSAGIRMGVRRDIWGGHTGYRIQVEPTKDELWHQFGMRTGGKVREIPAEHLNRMGAGSSGILAAVFNRSSQTRGQPWAACVMHLLHMLGMYEQAALVSARIGASKLGFLIDGTAERPDGDGDGDYLGSSTIDGEPGTIQRIVALPGEVDFKSWDPNDPNGDYPAFRKGMLQGIAAGLKISYNVLGSDLEGVSFSSIRQGTLTEREIWKVTQRWWIETVELPVYRAWLAWQLMRGALGNLSFWDFDRLAHVEMDGRRWDYVNPLQDAQAEVLTINNGLNSRQRANRKRGQTFGMIAKEQREDNEIAAEEGIELGDVAKPAEPEEDDTAAE
jgi:lambda family phage portal protein